MTISVDFDGVLHAYSRGWQDGTLYDDPVVGAAKGLRDLMRRDAVFVLTARDDLYAVARWLKALLPEIAVVWGDKCSGCLGKGLVGVYDGPSDLIPCPTCAGNGVIKFWNRRDALLVTNRKLPAHAYVDDRAVRFTSWEDLRADDWQTITTR
jgi:hypothetical protein